VLLLAKPYRKSDLAQMIRGALAADMRLHPLPEEGTVHLHPDPDVQRESSPTTPI
jgi:hypothetical protein